MPDALLTLNDYAAESDLGVDAVRGLVKSGKLRAIQVGNGTQRRHYKLSRRAIDEFERGEIVQPEVKTPARKKRKTEDDFVKYY